jgi:hypothetical protein
MKFDTEFIKRHSLLLYNIVATPVGLLALFGSILSIGSKWIILWRISSGSFIAFGLLNYLYSRNFMPEWVPSWGRKMAPVVAILQMLFGVVLFILSWLA